MLVATRGSHDLSQMTILLKDAFDGTKRTSRHAQSMSALGVKRSGRPKTPVTRGTDGYLTVNYEKLGLLANALTRPFARPF